MHDQYGIVLRTYLRRPAALHQAVMPVFGVLLMGFTFAMAAGAFGRGPSISAQTMGAVITTSFIGVPMWQRLRDQLVSERRRLLPNFIVPQLHIFGVLWFALAVVWPGTITLASGSNTIGLTACVALFSALLGWCVAVPSVLSFAAMFFVFVCGTSGSVEQRLLNGENESGGALILFAAVLLAAGAVYRMLRLTEDDPAYVRRLGTGGWQFGSRTLSPIPGGEFPAWIPIRRLQVDSLDLRRSGILARSRRWRAAVRPIWFIFYMLPTINLLMQWFFLQRSPQVDAFRSTLPFMTATYMSFPATMIPGAWLAAWPSLELDFLRPVTRRDFLQEVGTAIGVQMLQAWAIIAVISTAGAVLLRVPLTPLVCVVLSWLGLQLLGFGIAVWIMRFRLPGLQALLPILMFVPIAALAASQALEKSSFPLYGALASGAFTLIGIWLTWLAYRRWLETELG